LGCEGHERNGMEWVVRPIGVLPPSRSGLARVIPPGSGKMSPLSSVHPGA
jgi:hypothetical protein